LASLSGDALHANLQGLQLIMPLPDQKGVPVELGSGPVNLLR